MKRLAIGVMLLTGACSDGQEVGPSELANELRLLRTSIEQQQARPPVAFDRQALTDALAPLTQAMQTLAGDQQDLRARQQALTGEMQRWGTLVGAGLQQAQQEPRDQLAQLQQRLQQLEAELKAQDDRHKQVQELLRKSLDSTADRLDTFLQRLQTLRPVPTGAETGKTATPTGEEATARRGQGAFLQPGFTPAGRERRVDPWTWSLLVTALAAMGFFAWRLRREGTTTTALASAPAPHAPRVDTPPEEIWAAAALLSEAVDRLKAATPGSTTPAATVADDDDVFVIDETEDEAGSVLAPTPDEAAPPLHTVVLPCRNPAGTATRVQELLAREPAVLRRPAPVLTTGSDQLRIDFVLLPHLAAAELPRLRARLQSLAS